MRGPLTAIVKNGSDLCIVCPERDAPSRVRKLTGWRCLRLAGDMDHAGESGVLLTVVEPLARSGIPVFPVTSWDEGYVLIAEPHVEKALATLTAFSPAAKPMSRPSTASCDSAALLMNRSSVRGSGRKALFSQSRSIA